MLADESTKAVQGIANLTKNIQSGVQSIVTQIQNQVQTASEEVAKGTQTNVALDDMTVSVNNMARAI